MKGMRFVMLAIACSGCMIGSISPPARVSATGGLAVQATGGGSSASPGLILRSEADILSAFDRHLERPLDVGLGFALVDLPDAELLARYGPMASGRAHVWTGRISEDAVGRLSIGGNADVLFTRDGFGGAGGTFTVDLEVAVWAPLIAGAGGDANESGVGFGALIAEGETGIGLRAETSYHVLDDETHRWMFVLGLTVRIPAHVAVMVVVPTRT